ncbi:hypothetical protein GCM10010103_77640 [Streptomyces paradoxus]|uniref:NhaP-type Na+/H+ or K+/H+ antiporter n=1 Tax=Streptomyces paradoxus TaxID=66375 RepID=A0A7W9TGX9_9ACTN|nr:hypothetical protein [Streptomyces paradoxus]MBB6079497.1 NhaP-type Na+/H+ or K+/H+ antiporter [Streptomyces paradoxus]
MNSEPAGYSTAHHDLVERKPMSRTHSTRRERLLLTAAAVRGAVSGTVRAVLARFLEHLTP